jgi:hypothetical protein
MADLVDGRKPADPECATESMTRMQVESPPIASAMPNRNALDVVNDHLELAESTALG